MLIIGLAGGIATGKSLIAAEAARLPGIRVLDADQIAWETYRRGTPVYEKLVERFGERILAGDGEIERRRLGEIIFQDEAARRFLNSVIHPAVSARLRELAKQQRAQGTKLLVIEAALLLESEHAVRDLYDYVVLVKTDSEEQVRRLMERTPLSRAEALRKVQARVPMEEQSAKADFVIETTGTIEETKARARELFTRLLREAESRRNEGAHSP
jgi:dephospho-CoA kinase